MTHPGVASPVNAGAGSKNRRSAMIIGFVATLAMAASLPVVYPHMNSIGGDGFWVIGGPSGPLQGIDASGASAGAATLENYAKRGVRGSIPFRGGVAALTVAGTVSGWGAAHALSREWGGTLPLSRLLEDALWYAREGIPVTHSQWACTEAKRAELAPIAGFAETFLQDGVSPAAFSLFRQPRLAAGRLTPFLAGQKIIKVGPAVHDGERRKIHDPSQLPRLHRQGQDAGAGRRPGPQALARPATQAEAGHGLHAPGATDADFAAQNDQNEGMHAGGEHIATARQGLYHPVQQAAG